MKFLNDNFAKDDRVVVNDTLPLLVGEAGTVTDPEYQGYVMVNMDNEQLRNQAIGCFLPEELDQAK